MRRLAFAGILLMALAVSLTGLTWGLPSRRADRYLFSAQPPWPGQRLVELKGSDWNRRGALGADVDIDPLTDRSGPIELTQADHRVAEILIRYRLYTHQPDEPSTLRALASMRPSQLDFDPKLYQYGGLFIYPVGALIGLCSACGWIEGKHDLSYWLDHPEAFGRLYVVARMYSASLGLLGIVACYLLGRRLGGTAGGLLAAGLFPLLPVVVTMSHEAKPHLGGAVLILLAALAAVRYVETGRRSCWWGAALLSGSAFGMVLSDWTALAVLPVAAWQRPDGDRRQLAKRLAGVFAAAVLVFLLVNPYLAINLIAHRDTLRSSLQTSTAMYEVGRVGQGLWNVTRLLIEGTGPVLGILAVVGCGVLTVSRNRPMWLVLAPAVLTVLQFACIGAGKPGEYGRFLVYPAAVIAVLAACAVSSALQRRRTIGALLAAFVIAATALDTYRYLRGFVHDACDTNTRSLAARWLSEQLAQDPDADLGILREPAPYCVPPLDFAGRRVVLLPPEHPGKVSDWPHYVVSTCDDPDDFESSWWRPRYDRVAIFPSNTRGWFGRPTLISWADKPVVVFRRKPGDSVPASSSTVKQDPRLPVTRPVGGG